MRTQLSKAQLAWEWDPDHGELCTESDQLISYELGTETDHWRSPRLGLGCGVQGKGRCSWRKIPFWVQGSGGTTRRASWGH